MKHLKSVNHIGYAVKDISVTAQPYVDAGWVLSEIFEEKRRILEFNRKKTTQKVNLYEKVQIPGYQEAIRKIKRYMEDEENLSKASSKIVKGRHAAQEEEEESV